jgi:polysaccharide export outer membrane protein
MIWLNIYDFRIYDFISAFFKSGFMRYFLLILLTFCSFFAQSNEESANSVDKYFDRYLINAGDIVSLQVWNEPTLSADQLLVRPDGFVSVPAIGEVKAGGKSINELEELVSEKLDKYLKDKPTVIVSILAVNGSQVFVLGKVNAPGAYPMIRSLDVTQAIALARGLNSFASEGKIKVLRRDIDGDQYAISVKYNKIKAGEELDKNIMLKSGDVVLVP